MGRVPLINSGGESKGEGDLGQAVRTAVINKRAGGTGLIVGRKAFQRPLAEGVELLNAVQDVYLDGDRHRRLSRRSRAPPGRRAPATIARQGPRLIALRPTRPDVAAGCGRVDHDLGPALQSVAGLEEPAPDATQHDQLGADLELGDPRRRVEPRRAGPTRPGSARRRCAAPGRSGRASPAGRRMAAAARPTGRVTAGRAGPRGSSSIVPPHGAGTSGPDAGKRGKRRAHGSVRQ